MSHLSRFSGASIRPDSVDASTYWNPILRTCTPVEPNPAEGWRARHLLSYCEFDGGPFPGIEGYEKYLQLWPDGPEADEAWWRAKVYGPACGDFEGTSEEYVESIDRYSTFLKKFPKSPHASMARGRINEAMEELKR